MKFSLPISCSSCGCNFAALGLADKKFPPAHCPQCGAAINIIDPLTFSIVSVRLLYRSQAELDGGDYTLSIICSAIAIEAALTQLFVKWKEIDHGYPATTPTDADREAWELEYRDKTKPGGFGNSANFVSKYVTKKTFYAFVEYLVKKYKMDALVAAGFPNDQNEMTVEHIQSELFTKRNRIMHWGVVNYTKEDAVSAYTAALTAFGQLNEMDKERRETMEAAFKKSLGKL